MKAWIVFLVVALGPVAVLKGAGPEHFQTPEKLVAALYAPYQAGGKEVIPAPLSKEALPGAEGGYLHRIFGDVVAGYLKGTEDDPAGLGFDVLVDGQDFELSDFRIHEAEINETPSGRVAGRVIVTFNNFGEPREMWIGVERVEGRRPWQLTAIRAEKGHEGRSYDVVRLLESAVQADAGSGGSGVDFSMERTKDVEVIRAWVKELDPALAKNLEKNYVPLGHTTQEVRVARRGGEFGDSPLGRSEAFPFVSLWKIKEPKEGEYPVHQLWMNGTVELLDEGGQPLVITDPLPTGVITKPVVEELFFDPTGNLTDVPEGETADETLGHYLLDMELGGTTATASHEVSFEDERSATLTQRREGGLVAGMELIYSEGGHGAWRFTTRTWTTEIPNVLLVEILDDDGKLQHAEGATAWVLHVNGGKVVTARHNKGTKSEDRRTWPQVELKQQTSEPVIRGFVNLAKGDRGKDAAVVEELVNAWMSAIEP